MSDDLTAGWLGDPGRQGVQDTFSAKAARSLDSRKNTPETGYNTTSALRARKASGMLPFKISLYEAGTSSSVDLVERNSLTLLINPSDMNTGSSQVQNSQYARDGHVNSLWGSEQGTLTGNGSSAAFINFDGGLAATSFIKEGVAKVDSIAYANVMAFISMIRSNGYRHLIEGSSNVKANLNTKVNSLNKEHGVSTSTGEAPETNLPISSFNPSAMTSKMLGANRTRVIHVMDTVGISYGGTTYLGTFNSFTLEDDANNPFRFSYSFEFVVSGILGDSMEGHLSTASNASTGIKTYVQGLDGGGNSSTESRYALNLEKVNEYLKNIPAPTQEVTSDEEVLSEVNDLRLEGVIQVKKGAQVANIRQVMVDILPTVSKVYAKYAAESSQTEQAKRQWNPPVITSGTDGERKPTSLHYWGLALDVRVNGMPEATKLSIFGELGRLLPPLGFFVLLHPVGTTTEHLHIEYDPKDPGFKKE